jgi:hypothetical protein
MQALCQHRCPPFFWTLPTRIDQQIRNPSVAVLFARGRTPARPVNANCTESNGRHGRFAKRRTTGPWRNGRDCLNAATVLDCVGWRAMTSRAEIALRRMGRAQRNPSLSQAAVDGYRCAPPILQSGSKRAGANAQIQIVRSLSCSTHFRLNPDMRHVRFAFHVQSGSVMRQYCNNRPPKFRKANR